MVTASRKCACAETPRRDETVLTTVASCGSDVIYGRLSYRVFGLECRGGSLSGTAPGAGPRAGMTQSVVVQGELPPCPPGRLGAHAPACLSNVLLSLPRRRPQSDSAETRSAAASGTWR